MHTYRVGDRVTVRFDRQCHLPEHHPGSRIDGASGYIALMVGDPSMSHRVYVHMDDGSLGHPFCSVAELGQDRTPPAERPRFRGSSGCGWHP